MLSGGIRGSGCRIGRTDEPLGEIKLKQRRGLGSTGGNQGVAEGGACKQEGEIPMIGRELAGAVLGMELLDVN